MLSSSATSEPIDPLEVVRAVLPVLQVGIQVRVHRHPFARRGLPGAYRVAGALSQVQPGEKIGLPAAVVAFAGGTRREDVVLGRADRVAP